MICKGYLPSKIQMSNKDDRSGVDKHKMACDERHWGKIVALKGEAAAYVTGILDSKSLAD